MRSQVPHIPAMRLRTIAAWCVSLTLMPILSVTAAPVGAPTPAQYTQALGMSDHYASLVDRQPTAPVMGRCRTFSVSTWGGAQSPGAGRRSVSRPGRLGTAGDTLEMPIQTVVRLGQQQGVFPQGLRSFADSIGRDGARLAAFDFVSQKALLDISKDRAAAKRYVPLKALAARGRYASSPERPLNIYGTHVIPLTPQTGAKAISVSLQGKTVVDQAAWRFTLVSLDAKRCVRACPYAWQPCCFPHALSPNATRRGACAQAHCDQLMKLERMGDSNAELSL